MQKLAQPIWKPSPPASIEARDTSRVIAAASDLALVVDREGVIGNVSIGESLKGYPGWDKLLGQSFRETVAPDSQAKVDQLLHEARNEGTARPREINQKNAEAGDVLFRYSAVLLDQEQRVVVLGRELRTLSAVQQQMVLAQQAMEREYERMRQAETRYRLLFQLASEGVLVADTVSFKVLETNPAAASFFDKAAPALQGRTLAELFAAPSWPAVRTLLAAVMAGGRPADIEVSLPGRDRAVTVSAALFRQSGTSLLLLRLQQDGAPQAAGGARSSRMLAALDALPDGFVVMGEDRRILCANAAFCDAVQQTHENQVVGQPLERFLGRTAADLNIILANLREHGSVRNFATILRGDYGVPQEAVVSAVAASDAKVPCIGFAIRLIPVRLAVVPMPSMPMLRSSDQLRELVGRVSLKEIVRESADLIERLFIEAALQVSGDNRASAAQILGLSRQGLYSKLRRYGLGELDPLD